MSSLTRTMLPAFALAAMMSVAQAQTTTDQDHNAHHPDGAAPTAQAQPVPAPIPAPTQPAPGAKPGTPGNAPMMGQGMGSGMVVQPGTQAQGGQPGMMMMNMDQMRSMMGSMMGQQDGQSGMMSMMRQMMMGQQGAMGLPFEHVEGRIAFLKAELKITDAQTAPWNAFADTLRANAKAHQAVHEQMTKGGMPSSWPDRLAVQQKMLGMRLDAVKALEAAAKPLYAVLTDEQKKLADKLLTGPMGMM
ncbi:Spy/CpxP family protein refolding chaperone [Azospirillum sp.]|uniref:Spy/CpxP family protein refolding chaperone n=1 Tax=Azospirillum sp. TaxID=34012 RepID=UPI003D70BED9